MNLKFIKFTKDESFKKKLFEIVPDQPLLSMAFCGGRSIVFIIEALNSILKQRSSNYKAIMLDERIVPLDDPDSNYKLVSEALSNEKLGEIFPFNTENLDQGLKEYDVFLDKINYSLDIVFLGVGEDGHVAALFPNYPELKEREEKILIFNNSPKLPKDRMTLSIPILKKSKNIVLLFIGESKRDAFNRFNDNITSEYVCPVKFFKDSKNCFVVTDLI